MSVLYSFEFKSLPFRRLFWWYIKKLPPEIIKKYHYHVSYLDNRTYTHLSLYMPLFEAGHQKHRSSSFQNNITIIGPTCMWVGDRMPFFLDETLYNTRFHTCVDTNPISARLSVNVWASSQLIYEASNWRGCTTVLIMAGKLFMKWPSGVIVLVSLSQLIRFEAPQPWGHNWSPGPHFQYKDAVVF